MTKHILYKTIALMLTSGLTLGTAGAQTLDRDAAQALFDGATGTHWYLDNSTWYTLKWQSDGKLEAYEMGAKPDAKPVDKGTWRVKSVTPRKGESDESVAARSAQLRSVYCHQFESMFSGHDLCWDIEQRTFDKAEGDDKALAPTQRYTLYREAGAESGEYVITRR